MSKRLLKTLTRSFRPHSWEKGNINVYESDELQETVWGIDFAAHQYKKLTPSWGRMEQVCLAPTPTLSEWQDPEEE